MARSPILVSLERHYALALGKFEIAEHAIEDVIGLKAVIEADARIQIEKKKLKVKMDRIAYLIRVQVDPDWEPGHIRPIHLRNKSRRQGEVSKAAYRVLKEAPSPLRVREIAHLIAPEVGADNADYIQMNRLASALDSALNRRLEDGMVTHDGGTPKRWSFRPLDARRQASAFSANSRPIL